MAVSEDARAGPLAPDELRLLDAYWRAANYLSVGQIYLLDNPLLREPLASRARQAAPARPLGHDARPELRLRAPQPGHPRARPERPLRLRPGSRRPGMVANAYLEGTYSELYPQIGQDADGTAAPVPPVLVPGGIPSHAAPETPGSINEGGELGYSSRTPSARPSTTPTCSSPAWSATARPRPVRSRRAGTRTSSWTRRRTAQCCRSCT